MTELLALSVSIAVLGGIWAFIALGPLGGFRGTEVSVLFNELKHALAVDVRLLEPLDP